MNWKKLGTLTAVLLILVAAVLIGQRISKTESAGNEGTLFWPGFNKDECIQITIKKGDTGVTLKKAMDGWLVSGDLQTSKESPGFKPADADTSDTDGSAGSFPADSAKVISALEIFEDMKRDIFISKNPEKHGVFEIDSNSVTATFLTGDKEHSFTIGKRGSSYNSNFISVTGSERVYDVQGGIKTALSPEVSKWQDKSITDFKKNHIERVTLNSKDSGEIIMEKTTDTSSGVSWKISGDAEGSGIKKEVNKLLGKLASFKATGFETEYSLDSPETGIQDPGITVDIELSTGETKGIIIGNKKEDSSRYWAAVPEGEYLYLVSEGKVKDINISPSSLIKKEGLAAK
ncbi:MAG: DUF4340 domain-containing protein [Chitinivibrionales bacterium]